MTARPEVQIVRPDDETISVYVGGKEIAYGNYDMHGRNGMGAIEDTARAMARALGADVEDVTEPDAQPYVYFVVYQGEYGHLGNAFHTTPTPIEDASSVMRLTEEIMKARPTYGRIVVTNFICTDGPS